MNLKPALLQTLHTDQARLVVMQGMPEGYTEPCYPVRRPGINYHRQAPLSASDIEKRDVCPLPFAVSAQQSSPRMSLCLLHAMSSARQHMRAGIPET